MLPISLRRRALVALAAALSLASAATDDCLKAHPWGEKDRPNAPGERPGPVR